MSIFHKRVARVGMTRSGANVLLFFVAASWGLSYVLLKMGADTLHPFQVLAWRFTFASLACVLIFKRKLKQVNRRTLCCGVLLGTIMFGCSTALIFGELTTDASTAGFLTSAAIVLVPLIQSIRKRRLPEPRLAFSILLATVGIALLSLTGGLVLSAGALLCLLSAFCYATHTITTGEFVQHEDAFRLGVIQQLTMCGWGWLMTLIFSTPTLPGNGSGWLVLVALGIFCGAFPFVAQPLAQSFTSAEHTALILSLEPVFGALFSMIMLSEAMTLQAVCGAALVLASVLLTTYRRSGQKKNV